MKLSISLKKPKAPAPTNAPFRPSVFAAGDDDEEAKVPVAMAYNIEASKAMQKRIEQEKQVDATVYDYDEVWDRMQEAKQKQKEVKQIEALERKPKYIHNLLSSAATRKLDHLRAEEKMMQRERELEGDEFKDKEAFVTQAYKDQLAEIRRAEAEEKRLEELEKTRKGAATGMTHFYRKLLEESEQQHEAAVAAQKRVYGPQGPNPNLTITKPPNFTPKSDLELAEMAREQGKEVELNDDNQIVDKRDLLAAGLNLSLPNTRNLASLKAGGQSNGQTGGIVQTHRAVGLAASRKSINERRAREIQSQMEEEKEREQQKKRETEEATVRRIGVKRNNEETIESARERYLQRKRERLEQKSVTAPSLEAPPPPPPP